jgi:hypothetical protein
VLNNFDNLPLEDLPSQKKRIELFIIQTKKQHSDATCAYECCF